MATQFLSDKAGIQIHVHCLPRRQCTTLVHRMGRSSSILSLPSSYGSPWLPLFPRHTPPLPPAAPLQLLSLAFPQKLQLSPTSPAPGEKRLSGAREWQRLGPRGPEAGKAELRAPPPVRPRPGPAPGRLPALPRRPRALGAARRCSLAPGCLSSGSALAPAPSAACGRGSQPIRSLAAPPLLCQQQGSQLPTRPWGEGAHPSTPPPTAESLTPPLSCLPPSALRPLQP